VAQRVSPTARWAREDLGDLMAHSAALGGCPLGEWSAAEQQDDRFGEAARVVELTPADCWARPDSALHDSALADCSAALTADDR